MDNYGPLAQWLRALALQARCEQDTGGSIPPGATHHQSGGNVGSNPTRLFGVDRLVDRTPPLIAM